MSTTSCAPPSTIEVADTSVIFAFFWNSGVNETNSFLSQFVKYRSLQTLTREVVVELIDMIYVHEGGKITIKFKFSDAYAAAQDYIRKHGKTA